MNRRHIPISERLQGISPSRYGGFILLPVVLTLAVLAAVAFLLSREGAMNTGSVQREQQQDTARYVAEAGYHHASWNLNHLNCSGYTDLSTTSLGAHNYTATFTDSTGTTLTAGSPANIKVVGTDANGASYSLERNGVKIYQFPTQQLFLQPDATAGKDTYLYEWKSTWNYGVDTEFQVTNEFAFSLGHGLLQFDLSGLPVNAVIQNATLELYQHSPSAKGGDVSVHRVTGAWEEGIKSGGVGASNWTQSATAINWTNAGGDYDATAATTTSVAAGGVGWYQWEIKSLVQGWADTSYPNQGLMLVPSSPNTSTYFHSSDHSTPLLRPKLSITYTCECGVVCGDPPPVIIGELLFVSSGFTVYAFPSGEATTIPTTEEQVRITLMQSWGYNVTVLSESAVQADFDTAVAATDVVYVPSTITQATLAAKLDNAAKGIVFEQHEMASNYGLSDTPATGPSVTDVQITDNSHYITADFALGALPLFTTATDTRSIGGALTPDNIALATASSAKVLDALESGAREYDNSISPGRRVKLPWGAAGFDPTVLTPDGETLMQRAIQWGAAVDPGLLAHWKMDEGTGSTAADSVGGHHGTLTGPGWASGQINGATSFDGSNDFIDVPHDEGLWLTGELSMTAWIRAAEFGSGYQSIISKDTPGNGASNYWFGTWQNELVFGFFASGAFRVVNTAGLGLLPDRWYHLAASFDNATDEVLLYVDGVLVHTGSIAFEPTTETANLLIGTSVDNEYWPGRLDDVRIYDRALHNSEVTALYTGGGGISGTCEAYYIPDTLVATRDTTAYDNTTMAGLGYAPTGTVFNGATAPAGGMWLAAGYWGATIYTIDMAGNELTSCSVPYDEVTGVTLVESGTYADHLAITSSDLDTLRVGFISNTCNLVASFSTTAFGSDDAMGIAYIGSTESATYDGHLAVIDRTDNTVYIIDQSGSLQTSLDLSPITTTPHGVEHIPGTDKLLLVDDNNNQAVIINFMTYSGTALASYDTSTFGIVDAAKSISINRESCDHAVTDNSPKQLISMNLAGSGPGPGGCAATFADDFETGDYTGNTGDHDWNGNWTEVNESNNPNNGDEIVTTQDGGNHVVRVRDNDGGGEGILRSLDLSSYASATLSFNYWRGGLDTTDDYVSVQAWPNASNQWEEVFHITTPPGTDAGGSPQSASIPITDYMMNDTHIRFITSPNMGATDAVYLDNIEVCAQ